MSTTINKYYIFLWDHGDKSDIFESSFFFFSAVYKKKFILIFFHGRIKDAIVEAKDLKMFPKEQSLTDIVKSFPQKKDMTDKPSRKIDLSGFLYLSDNILYKIRELTEKSSKEVSFKGGRT